MNKQEREKIINEKLSNFKREELVSNLATRHTRIAICLLKDSGFENILSAVDDQNTSAMDLEAEYEGEKVYVEVKIFSLSHLGKKLGSPIEQSQIRILEKTDKRCFFIWLFDDGSYTITEMKRIKIHCPNLDL